MLTYFDAVPHHEMLREYPIGRWLLDRFTGASRGELRALQNRRFVALMRRAWQVPFYRRHWSARGIEPGDITSLDDVTKLPSYSKSDLMKSVEASPPLGDFHGMDTAPPQARPAVVFHTTSGTTGRPQPVFWGPRSREMQNLMLARAYLLQGLRPTDVVQSVYGHGLVNGGHYVRETFLHFTSVLFISAGTGVETRSRTQVEYLRDFGVTVVVGFADYIRRLAEVARDMGVVPGRDLRVRMISGHIGRESRQALSAAWGGAEVFDWYGVADTGTIAAEGPDHDGLHLWEDAHHVEVIGPDTHDVLPDGARGNLCVTVLFKDDVFPVVRFNTNDLTEVLPSPSPLRLPFRRIRGFLGRSDNMVKLRGINVYPTAVGELLHGQPGATGEFVCRVHRIEGRDEMTVQIEVRAGATERPAAAAAFGELLRRRFGVEVLVEAVEPGALSALTGIESRQKPIRLIDHRPLS